jgi:uncharacterized RDD family membrane protein YckC
MYCTKCGTAVAEGGAFCTGCGAAVNPVPVISQQPAYAPPPAVAASVPPVYYAPVPPAVLPAPYAGFWLRAVAYLLDGLLFAVILGIFVAIAIGIHGPGYFRDMAGSWPRGGFGAAPVSPIIPMMFIGTLIMVFAFMFVISWLYYAVMESSANQGTLGKIVMGLIVTDTQGRRISFGRASGRFFSRIITKLIPLAIGYIMAGFTEKKQALHDMIASCLVLKKV